MTDDSTGKVSDDPELPSWKILDQGDDQNLKTDKESCEPERVRIVFHQPLDLRVLVENELSSGCMWLIVVHEVELLGITIEIGSRVSIWEWLFCWNVH